MNKTVFVKAYFKPIFEDVAVKVPTGETKTGLFGGQKNVTRTEKQRALPCFKFRMLKSPRVRQSGRPAEQPRRERPPTDARTRASHARLSRTLNAHRNFSRASLYRKQPAARFVAWREFANLPKIRRPLSDNRHTCGRAV
jgi:hypothetical protein